MDIIPGQLKAAMEREGYISGDDLSVTVYQALADAYLSEVEWFWGQVIPGSEERVV